MGKSLIDTLLDQVFDAKWVGKRGETLTARELKLVNLLGRKGKIFKNLYVPKENGDTSEIDVVFLSQKGIFVIESKNYSGWIFGAEKDLYWIAQLSGREKNRFYNPIKQNQTHIKWLQNYLAREIPLFSIIVFSERCELKKIQVDSPEIRVIQRDRLYATIRSIWDAAPDVLEEAELDSISEKLEALTHADKATKQAHVASIQERYQSKTKAQSSAIPIEPSNQITAEEISDHPEQEPIPLNAEGPACPRCGSPLVLRTAKKGANAGNQFYGCSAFPRCRYTQTID